MAATAAGFPQAFVTHARSYRFSLPPATPNNARRSRLRRRGRDARDASLGDEWTDDENEDDALSSRLTLDVTRTGLTRFLARAHVTASSTYQCLLEATATTTAARQARRCCLSHDTLNTDSAAHCYQQTNTNAADTNSGIPRSAAAIAGTHE